MIITTYRTTYNYPNGTNTKLGLLGCMLKENPNHSSNRYIEDRVRITSDVSNGYRTLVELDMLNNIIIYNKDLIPDEQEVRTLIMINKFILERYHETQDPLFTGEYTLGSGRIIKPKPKELNYNDAMHHVLSDMPNLIIKMRETKLNELGI
jgi:hypothetical protein